MYGTDVERILKFISGINSSIGSINSSLSNVVIGEYPVSIRGITNPISTMYNTMQIIDGDIRSIAVKSFKSIYAVNNSYGSPYTELYSLTSALTRCVNIVNRYTSVSHYSEISEIINVLNESRIYASDAKYAVITYNEHIQQGYDKIIHKIL